MNNYIVTFEYRVMVTAFAIFAMFRLCKMILFGEGHIPDAMLCNSTVCCLSVTLSVSSHANIAKFAFNNPSLPGWLKLFHQKFSFIQ